MQHMLHDIAIVVMRNSLMFPLLFRYLSFYHLALKTKNIYQIPNLYTFWFWAIHEKALLYSSFVESITRHVYFISEYLMLSDRTETENKKHVSGTVTIRDYSD